MRLIAKILVPIVILSISGFFVFQKYKNKPTPKLDFSGEKKITVSDNGLAREIVTKSKDVAGVLGESNIQLAEKDEVVPARNTELYPGMNILINRAAKITIAVDGENREVQTLSKTVGDVLNSEDIELAPQDQIDPQLETPLRNNLAVTITRVKSEEITEEEDLDYKVIEQKDSKVDWETKEISQKGEKGVRTTVYKVHYENGKEISRTKLSSKITKNPVTQIVKIGTKLQVGKSDSGIASWYNAGINECASRDYPPGTWLRITNMANGKQAYARVEGYGPQKGTGKLIDLDNKTFQQIAPLGQGTCRVKVEQILSKGFKP
jgi:uncharacterized protein YabE (DUF348 family)